MTHDAAQHAKSDAPPPLNESGAMMALLMLAEIARSPNRSRGAAQIASRLNVDTDTMTLGLAVLAERGFITAAPEGAAHLLKPHQLRVVNWSKPHTLRLSPEGLAWVGRQFEPLWPLVLAALDRKTLWLDGADDIGGASPSAAA